MKCRLDKWTARYIENWLNCWDQRVVISSDHPSWSSVISCVLQGSILGLTLFNSFIITWIMRLPVPSASLLIKKLEGIADTTQTVHKEKEKLRQLGLFSVKMGRLGRILSCV